MFWNRKKAPEPSILIGTGVCLDNPGKIIPIRLSDSHRKRHTFVFGTTGVGKTRLAELMIEQDIRAGKNIDSVRQAIRRSAMEEMQQALDRLTDPEAQSVAGMIQDILESPQGYYEKVSSTLRTSLNELSSGNIGQIIGKAESNQFIERMEQGKGVILVVHTGSMITRDAGETLGRVVLSMIQSFVGRGYLSGRQKIDCGLSIYIDEAQSLFYKGIEYLFAKSGSAGVMIQAFAQSVNQLYFALDEHAAKSILDNTNTKIFMRCTDAETSEYVVQHFGTKKVLSTIYNPAQITTREVEEDVLRVQDILSLQPQDFYMMTYAGRHRGRTSTVKDSKLTIQFPDALLSSRPTASRESAMPSDLILLAGGGGCLVLIVYAGLQLLPQRSQGSKKDAGCSERSPGSGQQKLMWLIFGRSPGSGGSLPKSAMNRYHCRSMAEKRSGSFIPAGSLFRRCREKRSRSSRTSCPSLITREVAPLWSSAIKMKPRTNTTRMFSSNWPRFPSGSTGCPLLGTLPTA